MDKRTTHDEVIAELSSGMTIGIGGWGSRRKPMSLVRAIAQSSLDDLTIVSFGGPDVGLLCATGKVKKVVYGFVSLDSIPLEPHFRAARQSGSIEIMELDEGMMQWGLYAASIRVPFLPTRAGLGSDVMTMNPELKTVRSPYDDGEELVAMPAIKLDAALIHMNRADEAGNGRCMGPDLYFDDLFCGAAAKRFMSCEELVDEGEIIEPDISRLLTDYVIEAQLGAHFTECPPDYPRDEAFQKRYAASAKNPEAWAAFRERYVDVGSHEEYLAVVAEDAQDAEAQS